MRTTWPKSSDLIGPDRSRGYHMGVTWTILANENASFRHLTITWPRLINMHLFPTSNLELLPDWRIVVTWPWLCHVVGCLGTNQNTVPGSRAVYCRPWSHYTKHVPSILAKVSCHVMTIKATGGSCSLLHTRHTVLQSPPHTSHCAAASSTHLTRCCSLLHTPLIIITLVMCALPRISQNLFGARAKRGKRRKDFEKFLETQTLRPYAQASGHYYSEPRVYMSHFYDI